MADVQLSGVDAYFPELKARSLQLSPPETGRMACGTSMWSTRMATGSLSVSPRPGAGFLESGGFRAGRRSTSPGMQGRSVALGTCRNGGGAPFLGCTLRDTALALGCIWNRGQAFVTNGRPAGFAHAVAAFPDSLERACDLHELGDHRF
jgi:hypothetical protein